MYLYDRFENNQSILQPIVLSVDYSYFCVDTSNRPSHIDNLLLQILHQHQNKTKYAIKHKWRQQV